MRVVVVLRNSLRSPVMVARRHMLAADGAKPSRSRYAKYIDFPGAMKT